MKFSALLVVAILALTVSAAPHNKHRKDRSYSREYNSNSEDNSKHIDNSKTITQSNGGNPKPLLGISALSKETNSNSNTASIS